jgi:serine/threonine-protein kinase Chk1/5'-AMP-activated protein kinase catalytic alpha subunit
MPFLKNLFRPSTADKKKGGPIRVGPYAFEPANENVIGSGGYGKVYKGVERETDSPVAVKVVAVGQMSKWAIMEEIKLMEMSGNHPNVVQMLAHDMRPARGDDPEVVYIAMELATGGHLFTRVTSAGTLSEKDARRYFSQIMRGVDFLHSLGIVHRDLKLENILLGRDDQCKICDLGLAHLYRKDEHGRPIPEALVEKVGSRSYTAPEVLDGRGYDGFSVDCWS